MVDRKMYSRPRQKAFLRRVVVEELYKPDAPNAHRRVDRGISELLTPKRHAPPGGHPRNRVAGFMEPSPRIVPQLRIKPGPDVGVPAARPEGFLARLWRRMASLLPGIWS